MHSVSYSESSGLSDEEGAGTYISSAPDTVVVALADSLFQTLTANGAVLTDRESERTVKLCPRLSNVIVSVEQLRVKVHAQPLTCPRWRCKKEVRDLVINHQRRNLGVLSKRMRLDPLRSGDEVDAITQPLPRVLRGISVRRRWRDRLHP